MDVGSGNSETAHGSVEDLTSVHTPRQGFIRNDCGDGVEGRKGWVEGLEVKVLGDTAILHAEDHLDEACHAGGGEGVSDVRLYGAKHERP